MTRSPLVDLRPLDGTPLVSVLIPVHDYGRYLGEAIESVLAQTYDRVEVIVCDDGSRDHSLEVARRYAALDERVCVLSQENAGQAAAFSKAFAASRGEVICLLDADDHYAPDKAEAVVDAFSRSDAGTVVHPLIRTDETGAERGIYPHTEPLPSGWLGDGVAEAGGYVPWLSTGTMNLRREVAERIFPIDPAAGQFADVFIRGAACLAAPVVAVDRPLAFYRLHGSNHGNTAAELSREDAVARRRRDLAALAETYALLAEWATREDPTLHLARFETTRPYLERRYAIARLSEEPRAFHEGIRRQLLDHADGMSPALQLLYRTSGFLPRPVFRQALAAVQGQGKPKAAISALSRHRRAGRGAS